MKNFNDYFKMSCKQLKSLLKVGDLLGLNYKLLKSLDNSRQLNNSYVNSKTYEVYGLSLASGDASGYEVCHASVATKCICRQFCLDYCGRGQVTKGRNLEEYQIHRARIAKTRALFENPEAFQALMAKEILNKLKTAKKANKIIAFRLNVFSDVNFTKFIKLVTQIALELQIIDIADEIQFYDYSKDYNRCKNNNLANYHLTYSLPSMEYWNNAKTLLNQGVNVAIVSNEAEISNEFKGLPVIDGDLDDLRFLDKSYHVVMLKAKGKLKKQDNNFLIKTSS